jgi:hypothetical protein
MTEALTYQRHAHELGDSGELLLLTTRLLLSSASPCLLLRPCRHLLPRHLGMLLRPCRHLLPRHRPGLVTPLRPLAAVTMSDAR